MRVRLYYLRQRGWLRPPPPPPLSPGRNPPHRGIRRQFGCGLWDFAIPPMQRRYISAAVEAPRGFIVISERAWHKRGHKFPTFSKPRPPLLIKVVLFAEAVIAREKSRAQRATFMGTFRAALRARRLLSSSCDTCLRCTSNDAASFFQSLHTNSGSRVPVKLPQKGEHNNFPTVADGESSDSVSPARCGPKILDTPPSVVARFESEIIIKNRAHAPIRSHVRCGEQRTFVWRLPRQVPHAKQLRILWRCTRWRKPFDVRSLNT